MTDLSSYRVRALNRLAELMVDPAATAPQVLAARLLADACTYPTTPVVVQRLARGAPFDPLTSQTTHAPWPGDRHDGGSARP